MPKFELSRLSSYDDESLLSELRRVAALITVSSLTQEDFDQHSKASSSVISRRFGSWERALSRAGLGDRYSGRPSNLRKRQIYSDDELLAQMRDTATKVGVNVLTMQQFNEHSTVINAETIRRRFGSWWKASEKAGLKISNLGKRYSDEDYYENLLAVWTHYGRQPTYSEMDKPPSRIRAKTYESKWGTWKKALLAFIERANADLEPDERGTVSPSPKSEEAPAIVRRVRASTPKSFQEEQRNVSLGLRYSVLQRDRFRCVMCGASPAMQPGCQLHVDHVVPFSRGGRTTTENLQTLCATCNLGKGSRVIAKEA